MQATWRILRHDDVGCAAGAGDGDQRVPQLQGAPCWQPQPHLDGVAAGVWQPQVQAAPGQFLQEQDFDSVFMAMVLWSVQAGIGLWDKVWALCGVRS